MNKKRFAALVLALSLVFNLTVFAQDSGNESTSNPKVEIALKVGDSSLTINGKTVDVESPYILNATTLVPLRVITEAFGADVNWNAETQVITLTYSDVTIVLQIDQKTATVNSQQLDLLEAPELKNDNTMVPLRFITENFGADVTFNAKTNEIKVVKEITESNSIKDYSLILKRSQKFKIGDSFLGWSMSIPKTMNLSYRSFDGRKNEFVGSSGEADFTIWIGIYRNTENITMPQLAVYEKDNIKDYTLVSQETKKGPDGIEYVNSQYKTKTDYFYRRTALKGDDIISTYLEVNNDSNKGEVASYKKDAIAIVDSFALSITNKAEVEDLSDVDKDGNHIFDNKTFKFSMKIPAAFDDYSNEDIINEFDFIKRDKDNIVDGSIHISIYSNDSKLSLEDWANRDKTYNTSILNPEYTKFEDLADMTVDGTQAKYYKYSVENPNTKKSRYLYDVFLSKGEYGYNIAIESDKDDFNKVTEILNSFKAELLKKDEIGQIANKDLELNPVTRVYTSDNHGFKMEIPAVWVAKALDQKAEVFYAEDQDISFNVLILDSGSGNIRDFMSNLEKGTVDKGGKVLVNSTSINIDGHSGNKIVYREPVKTKGHPDMIITVYATIIKNKVYILQSIVPDELNGAYENRIFDNIIKTFKFES